MHVVIAKFGLNTLRPATFSRLDVFITSQRLVLKVVPKLRLHVKSEKDFRCKPALMSIQ